MESYEKIKEILQLDSYLNKIQDMDILMERILLETRKVVNADAGSIYIKSGDKLVIYYAQNDTKQKELPAGEKLIYSIFRIPINKKTISGYVADTGELLNISDVYTIPKDAPYSFDPTYDRLSGYRTTSNLTIPLKTNTGEILGVIQVLNALNEKGEVVAFSEDDEIMVMHFANNVTVALQRARMTRTLLLRMIKMAELRDPKETGAHVNRVAGFAVEIYERWAAKQGLPKKEIENVKDNLRMAAMLHDVGKVAISDLILKKPAQFTPEERETMKTHTTHGGRLFINKQSDFDDLAAIAAINHHENWDGTGYPGHIDIETGKPLKTDDQGNVLGKKEEEIPLVGRIVAIADVYDALRSKRVYKKAWQEEDVLSTMRELQGSKFDPELVDIFFEVLPNIQTIADKYPDEE
jgi:HD-GYP domain-containing protein (c-di-GMP phosphodiesterase class II)